MSTECQLSTQKDWLWVSVELFHHINFSKLFLSSNLLKVFPNKIIFDWLKSYSPHVVDVFFRYLVSGSCSNNYQYISVLVTLSSIIVCVKLGYLCHYSNLYAVQRGMGLTRKARRINATNKQ